MVESIFRKPESMKNYLRLSWFICITFSVEMREAQKEQGYCIYFPRYLY